MTDAADEPQDWCSAGLLPLGDAPLIRCTVQGPHDEHRALTGERWTDPDWL